MKLEETPGFGTGFHFSFSTPQRHRGTKTPSPSGRAPLHIAFLDKPRNQLKKAALSLWERGDPPRRVGEGIRNPYASPSRANFLPGKDIAIAVCHLEASPVKENSIHQKSINVNIKEEGTERFFGEASASWGLEHEKAARDARCRLGTVEPNAARKPMKQFKIASVRPGRGGAPVRSGSDSATSRHFSRRGGRGQTINERSAQRILDCVRLGNHWTTALGRRGDRGWPAKRDG